MVIDIKPAESQEKIHKGGVSRVWVWILLLLILSIGMTQQGFAIVFTILVCVLPIILLIAVSSRRDSLVSPSRFWYMDEVRFRIRDIQAQAERDRLSQMVEREPSQSAMPLYSVMYRIGGWLINRGSALQNHYGRLLGRKGEDDAVQQKRRSAW